MAHHEDERTGGVAADFLGAALHAGPARAAERFRYCRFERLTIPETPGSAGGGVISVVVSRRRSAEAAGQRTPLPDILGLDH